MLSQSASLLNQAVGIGDVSSAARPLAVRDFVCCAFEQCLVLRL